MPIVHKLFFSIFFLLLFFQACRFAPKPKAYVAQKTIIVDSAAVVSPHPLATEIGIDILKRGGNAIDAAVAIQFALAVVYPRAGNLGGGGFMVIRLEDGTIDALDYREKAPLSAHRDMYLDSLGNALDKASKFGHLAVGVPGTVAGLFAAHKRYGKLPIEKLIDPAINLAMGGFFISQTEADRLDTFQKDFKALHPPNSPFLKDDWEVDDVLVQNALAATLLRIQSEGKEGFYKGVTADYLVSEMENGKGLITHEDLAKYEAKWRTPVVFDYKNFRFISMPPPSSGGIALGQMLGMIEPYPIKEWGFHTQPSIHLIAEAARRAYADRATFLGDLDFYPVPIDSLLQESYLDNQMKSFSPTTASASQAFGNTEFELKVETFETTHTSVVDPSGNAVSVTTTLNLNYGSKVWVQGAGFFLNDEMDDFSLKPGVPNYFGLIGAEANAIQPEKRMLSSMTPTIVEKEGDLFMVLGSPGGATIITSVLQVFLNVAEFGMSLEEAVQAKRFHHQWLPDEIVVEEKAFDTTLMNDLKTLGHSFREVETIARVKAICKTADGKWEAVGDPRNPDDDARGF